MDCIWEKTYRMINYNIKGKDIKRLVTRFQYKRESMCFEILLKLDRSTEMIVFLKTDDYNEFKQSFDELMTIRSENRTVLIPSSSLGNSTIRHISAA